MSTQQRAWAVHKRGLKCGRHPQIHPILRIKPAKTDTCPQIRAVFEDKSVKNWLLSSPGAVFEEIRRSGPANDEIPGQARND